MNYVKHLSGVILALLLSAFVTYAQPYRLSDTRYDYSDVARQITAGCDTKYEQAEAIYRWLCENISYDTSLSIYTADECWNARAGVCQAYCELFYRLAEALGIKSYVIPGQTRTTIKGGSGHTWIFAFVEDDGTGILIDPTWGAGSLYGNVFVRSDNDMTWFDVAPEWMIFTHFPDNKIFQFLDPRVDLEQFIALPEVRPVWGEYGYNAAEMLAYCLENRNDMPELSNGGSGKVLLQDVPFQKTLRIGTAYTFSFRKISDCDISIFCNDDMFNDWSVSSTGMHMEIVPYSQGYLTLSIKGKDDIYTSFLKYDVAAASRDDLAALEAARPLAMPEILALQNAELERMEKLRINGAELLSSVRQGKVQILPEFFDFNNECRIVEMPYNGVLHTGIEYSFTLEPREGSRWIILNGEQLYDEWQPVPDSNAVTMTVTPQSEGELLLLVNSGAGDNYQYCLRYIVSK